MKNQIDSSSFLMKKQHDPILLHFFILYLRQQSTK